MTGSVLAAPRLVEGCQRPRILSVPSGTGSAGRDAVDLARASGLVLDPWQAFVLESALAERDGRWAAFEVALIVSRQNGKGAILEARELAGLFLLDERLILHSAHEFKTASEAFRRVLQLIQGAPDLDREVAKVYTSHGSEGIELKSGQRLRFVARSGGSGRGFSGDCIVLDEAYNLGPKQMAALLPTLSARPNPQLWYTSSAGMAESEQLTAVRERGIKGDSPGLAYFEWSAESDADLDDRRAWAQANPALGYRVSEDFIALEREAMPDIEFARERLGIWEDTQSLAVIPAAVWRLCEEPNVPPPRPVGRVAFAVDADPDRAHASIAVAGVRQDNLPQVQVVDGRRGVAWAVPALKELTAKWPTCAVVVDPRSAAGSLITDLEDAGIEVTRTGAQDVAQACGAFYDLAVDAGLRHLNQPELNAAVAGASTRPLGDAWAWDRRKPTTDITPLVSATLALWGWANREPEPPKYASVYY